MPNHLFVPVRKNDPVSKRAIECGEYPKDLTGQQGSKLGKTWRTYFGPCVPHYGVTYATDSDNIASALSRVFHDKVDVNNLHACQHLVVSQYSSLLFPYFDSISRLVSCSFKYDTSELFASTEANVHQPHVKRKLRERAWDELQSSGLAGSATLDFDHRPCRAKFKACEYAKRGKPGRIIVDLGVHRSLRAGLLVQAVKEAMDKVALRAPVPLVFVNSVDVQRLSSEYSHMAHEDRFIYFSDDSCLALHCLDGPMFLNLDISACDASNGPAIFELVPLLFPSQYKHIAYLLLSHCRRPLVVGYGSNKILVRPKNYFEYSGCLLTTLLNNLANLCIGLQLTRVVKTTRYETYRALCSLAENCGWSLTISPMYSRIEKIQFLKTSPCLTVHGELTAILNCGVILRTMGQCWGDLPGAGSVEARAYSRNCDYVASWIHAGNHPLLGILNQRYPNGRWLGEWRIVVSNNVTPLSLESLCARYSLSISDYEQMCCLFSYAGFGDIVDCFAIRRIMEEDYGL